jgi:hypothetical protein
VARHSISASPPPERRPLPPIAVATTSPLRNSWPGAFRRREPMRATVRLTNGETFVLSVLELYPEFATGKLAIH